MKTRAFFTAWLSAFLAWPAPFPSHAENIALTVAPQAAEEAPKAILENRPLDAERLQVIPTEVGVTTTVLFPKVIEAIDGVGFAIDPNEEGALFGLSTRPGAKFLSVHPVKASVRGNLNVLVDGQCHVLYFVEAAGSGVFRVAFQALPPPTPPAEEDLRPEPSKTKKVVTPARLISLLDQCKALPLLKDQHPELTQSLFSHHPNTTTPNEGFEILLKSVHREDSLDTLVFALELINPSKNTLYYNPEGFLARINELSYPQSLADASGEMPPESRTQAWFCVTGDGQGARHNLDPLNPWEVTVERLHGKPQKAPASPGYGAK